MSNKITPKKKKKERLYEYNSLWKNHKETLTVSIVHLFHKNMLSILKSKYITKS